MAPKSLLPVVLAADNFPDYPLPPSPPPFPYVPFHLTLLDHQAHLQPLGLLRRDVVRAMQSYNSSLIEAGKGSIWGFVEEGKGDEAGKWQTHVLAVYFKENVASQGKDELGRVMKECVESWKKDGLFPGPLAGWSG